MDFINRIPWPPDEGAGPPGPTDFDFLLDALLGLVDAGKVRQLRATLEGGEVVTIDFPEGKPRGSV